MEELWKWGRSDVGNISAREVLMSVESPHQVGNLLSLTKEEK